MDLETIIGLEIHIQPRTKSKMFCSCANVSLPEKANSSVCPICMGHPGVLPVVNKHAIELAVRASLALNFTINHFSKFDRKHYFYPDLPKGFQISQYDQPLAEEGYLELFIHNTLHKIGIERLHLEEDTAKNIHEGDHSLIDYNRSGVPLMEVVTNPEIRSPEEAKLFLQELRLIMRFIGVSDADMEKGQLRCDANISLRPQGDEKLYVKTEIKNLNSFKSVEKALEYEVKRQSALWEQGSPPEKLATRGWDEVKQETVEQRIKEEASDYRYFPEPDIPPLELDDAFIDAIRVGLPELPQAKRVRFMAEYAFALTDVHIIVQDESLSRFVEQVISELIAWLESSPDTEGNTEEIWEQNKDKLCKLVSGWLLSKLFTLINKQGIDFQDQSITAENFAEFLTMIYERKVNSANAQVLLEKMFETGDDPSIILQEHDLSQSSDSSELEAWVDGVIKANPDQVKQFKAGKEPVLKFLLGMVMRESKGKADPEQVEELLKNKMQ